MSASRPHKGTAHRQHHPQNLDQTTDPTPIVRFFLSLLNLDLELAMPPHRAGPDAWVTAHLLVELLQAASIEQMIQWTQEPKLMPNIPFGKHRGLSWAEAPLDYLQWMTRQGDMDADAIWNARQELSRRGLSS